MQPILDHCPKCHFAKWRGDECRGCKQNLTLQRAATILKPIVRSREHLIVQVESTKAEIRAINKVRDELKTSFEISHYLADYIVATWKLGHQINTKLFNDETLLLVNAGISYLNTKYGNPADQKGRAVLREVKSV